MDDPIDIAEPMDLRQKVEIALRTLTDAERIVIKHRYGLEDGFTRTIEEIADILRITAEEARVIESQAIARLKANRPKPGG
jgi:RNA polymerase primary sigma factor